MHFCVVMPATKPFVSLHGSFNGMVLTWFLLHRKAGATKEILSYVTLSCVSL